VRVCHFVFCTCVAILATLTQAFANNTFPGTLLTGSSGSISGTTVGATGETGEPASFGGGNLNTIWYSWTATATGTFTVATCNLTSETNTNFDTTLQAFTGNTVNAPLVLLAQNDDTTACNSTVNVNYGSTISFAVTAGTPYRIQVDGYASNTGTYTLRWGLAALLVTTTDNSATEGGDTAAFTVRPQSPPAGGTDIVVTIGNSTQCTFAPNTLTFTNANWTTAQIVTAIAIDDVVIEGTHSCAPASISAAGGTYVGITAIPPTLTVIDNENPQFTITKTQSGGSNPVTATGQAINYTITIVNTGNVPLTGTIFTDTFKLGAANRSFTTGPTLSGDAAPVGTVNVGETWTYTASYSVTLADMNATGNFTNQATFDTTETVPQISAIITTPVTRTPTLTIAKTWTFATDANSNGLADVGDVITYNYAVTNSGNVTLTNVFISDVHNGAGTLSAISPTTVASLNPGLSTNFTASYTTIQGDLDAP
jgi:uncharacterized repeat protein (TIGR01451 family)